MRYNEIQLEAFAPPVSWRWLDKRDFEYTAGFRIGKVQYLVSVFRYDSGNNAWELSFTAETKTKDYGFQKTGTGNAWKVFGTVIAIAKIFLRLKQPNIMKIENDHTERSRLAVNKRIAAAIADGTEYTVTVTYDDEIMIANKAGQEIIA